MSVRIVWLCVVPDVWWPLLSLSQSSSKEQPLEIVWSCQQEQIHTDSLPQKLDEKDTKSVATLLNGSSIKEMYCSGALATLHLDVVR